MTMRGIADVSNTPIRIVYRFEAAEGSISPSRVNTKYHPPRQMLIFMSGVTLRGVEPRLQP